jgi:hypothetical protein
MIDRQHGCIVICCDTCDEEFEGLKESEFEILWNTAKFEGWRSRKLNGEWFHSCPKCHKDMK